YENIQYWKDAGRCRDRIKEIKLEEIKAEKTRINIGSIGSLDQSTSVEIQDSVINRSSISAINKRKS
ncbi:MAG: hypothetical protein ACMUIE_04165, partial [Thermoplasmatota archaeon]